MRKRVVARLRTRGAAILLSVVTALGVLTGVGIAVNGSPATAAIPVVHASLINPDPIAAGPYHHGNIHCSLDGARTDGTWDHYCPSGWHYSQVAAEDVAGSIAPPVGVVKPPAATTGDEAAPTLTANGDPNLYTIPVKWTVANPPGNDTVIGYQVHFRKTSVSSWTSVPDLSNVLYTTVPVPTEDTQYFVQVRARYNTTDGFGPWSNTLTATTSAP